MESRFISIGKVFACGLAWLSLVAATQAAPVRADDYQNFWLWAGVAPQPVLAKAQQIYLLAGEVSDRGRPHVISQRPAPPRISGAQVWIVYRAQTLDWNDAILAHVLAHVQSWQAGGNTLIGLQIDFDAGTKHLDRYAAFLTRVREKLPAQYKLGVTGLLDWSANGGSAGLDALAGVVDELVLQIYQGRHVIPGYERYLARLGRLKVPFRIGLLQGGEWQAPEGLTAHAKFNGYVVFLQNQK